MHKFMTESIFAIVAEFVQIILGRCGYLCRWCAKGGKIRDWSVAGRRLDTHLSHEEFEVVPGFFFGRRVS